MRGDDKLGLLVCCLIEWRRCEANWLVKVMLVYLKLVDYLLGSSYLSFFDLLAVLAVWVYKCDGFSVLTMGNRF